MTKQLIKGVPSSINLVKLGFGLGFTPGKTISIVGSLKLGPSCIKLAEEGIAAVTADVPLHFSPRSFFRFVIRNSWSKKGGWTSEDRGGGFPFAVGRQFVLDFIAAPNNAIIINVDNKYFTTFSRWDLSKVSQIDFSGEIRIFSVKLCSNKIETTTTELPTTLPTPICPNPIYINNVSIGNIDLVKHGYGTGFLPGKSIIIVGNLLKGGSCIKLAEPGVITVTADVPFHMSANTDGKYVICNSWMKKKGGWTPEDRSGGYPFTLGKQFLLEYIAEENNTIRINVDNKFFRTFSREDLSKITQLDFSYAIRINSVALCNSEIATTTEEIPTTITPAPNCPNQVEITNVSIGNIDLVKHGYGTGFLPGKSIIIVGNLLKGGSCIKLAEPGVITVTADVPFHMSANTDGKYVICNSWMKKKGGWTPEDRSGGYPFTLGKQFLLEYIAEENNTIRINVDNKFFRTFSREDLSKITQLDFSYAIRINSVKLCRLEIETTTPEIPTTLPTPICPNPIYINNVSIGNIDLVKHGYGTGFLPGKSIIIVGNLLKGGSCIKLAEPGVITVTADVPFHMSANTDGKYVICNSWMKKKGGWTPEDRNGGYPFTLGKQFTLEYIAEENNTIRINVDNKFFRTFSREDLSKITQLDFSYAIRINSVALCNSEIATTTEEIPTTITPAPNCPNQVEITNVSIGNIDLVKHGYGTGFLPGKSIIIVGNLLKGGSCIKLAEPGVITVTADVPFHMSANTDGKYVICNSWMKKKGGWTPEDRSGGYPFTLGKQFLLEYIAEENNTIRINVDNKFFRTFSREDLSKITQLDFSYAIRINSVKLCKNDEEITTTTTEITPTPPPTSSCPYFTLRTDVAIPITLNLGNGFKTKKHITIIGTPTDQFSDFVVGLEEPGVSLETANRPFSFNPHLNDKTVVVNTWVVGLGWETEESYGHSPFKVGEPFVLEIIAGTDNNIIVQVNYQPYLIFLRKDLSKLSQLTIDRAIKVCSIIFCN
uniref:Galectin n=1 Tax=Meloidogyne hapla TaxID=6305 RepID=A0A1I8B6N7_MELHA